jgi:hypothetical protein
MKNKTLEDIKVFANEAKVRWNGFSTHHLSERAVFRIEERAKIAENILSLIEELEDLIEDFEE